jgi:hypothetical protein
VLYTREPKELWFCGCTVFPTEIFGAGIYSSTHLYGSRILINAVDLEELTDKGLARIKARFEALAPESREELKQGLKDTGTTELPND